MAGEENGSAPCLFTEEKLYEAVLHQGVQAAGGFIQQQEVGPCHKGTYQPYLLPSPLAHFPQALATVQPEQLFQLPGSTKFLHTLHLCHEAEETIAGEVVHQAQLSRQVAHVGLDGRCLGKAVHA